MMLEDCKKYGVFQSTPSARRATARREGRGGTRPISIHALREEGDGSMLSKWPVSSLFQSTPSARRATC